MARDFAPFTNLTGLPSVNRNPGSFETRAAELARRRRWAEALKLKGIF